MKDEIKVNEYVRTIDGYIRKVIQVNKKGTYEGLCYGAYSVDKKYKNSVGISAKKIIKHSPNIIDLVQNGDIVSDKDNSKYEVDFIINKKIYCNDYNLDDSLVVLDIDDLRSIITKELIERMEYKI